MVIKRFYGGMVKMGVLDFNRDDTLGTVESVIMAQLSRQKSEIFIMN